MTVFQTRDGCTLHYEIVGDEPPVALTPGGREPGRVLGPLVDELSRYCRVLTWDRRNTGASDLCFDASRSEYEIWADDLAELLQAIGFAPAIIAGGSAGCRVSLNAAIQHPSMARGLILWSATGGPYAWHFLGHMYHEIYIEAAQDGGMAAVAETPFFADRIKENPGNRDRLLTMDPSAFIATMRYWNRAFQPGSDLPIAGITGKLGSIRAPTLVFEGNDDIHLPEAAELIARMIPNARLVPSPWRGQEWIDIFSQRVAGSVFDLCPRLVPRMVEFIEQLEGTTKRWPFGAHQLRPGA